MFLSVKNLTTNQTTPLSRLPILRQRFFDLTDYCQTPEKNELSLRGDGQILLSSLSLLQIQNWPCFPDHTVFLWICAFLLMIGFTQTQPKAFSRYVLAGLLFLAFALRWKTLAGTVGHPLTGDAIDYANLVSQFSWSHPLSTGIREPAYIWLQSIVTQMIGFSEIHFRLFTVLISTAMTAMIYTLSLKLSQRPKVALLAALIWCVGDFYIWNSIRGERNDFFVLCLLGFTCYALQTPSDRWRNEALLALSGAFTILIWLIGSLPILGIYGLRAWQHKLPYPKIIFFMSLLGIVLMPFFYHHQKAHQDPFISLNAHVNFYKNAEKTGVPSYEGAQTNWGAYLLSEKGLEVIVTKIMKGYGQLFLNPLNSFNKSFLGFHYTQPYSYVLFPFLIWGICSLWIQKQWTSLYVIVSHIHVSAYFIHEFRDPRLLLHAAPFFCYLTAMGFDSAFQNLKKLRTVRNSRRL